MNAFSYTIIADAVDYLVANHATQPDLDHLARRAGYEPSHFQKLFRQHVGVSPKRLQQFMTLRHARDLLRQGCSTLDAAIGSGLSGQGRLHDLFVTMEAMTPGAVQRRGAGMSIRYAFHPTPLGDLLIARTALGICFLGFRMADDPDRAVSRLASHFPAATLIEDAEPTMGDAQAISAIWRGGQPSGHRLPLDLHGSNLQIQVWQALMAIPYGETATYSAIARQIGRPTASRAVGNAVGANPVCLLVPCHRVIRATGIIDNYGWGSPRKKLILAMEGALADTSEAEDVAH